MPKRLTESQALTTQPSEKSGRLQVQLISPGWGSSGYYSPKVLENAATAKVFPKGTHCYLDHPSESERHDRPERSVRDLAAVLTEDATVGPGNALVAEVQTFGPYKELLTDEAFTESIGMSIVAYADTTVGEAEGRKGTIVTELTEGVSTDFVTRAGRGGKVLAVLESARRVDEATANDTREALSGALRAAYGADETYVWVRDFDDENVWFTVEDADSMSTYQQGYTIADDTAVSLADGDPVEVRARTEYVPVNNTDASESHSGHGCFQDSRNTVTNRTGATEASPHEPPVAPAGSTPTHESPKEDTMQQIEESRLAQLEADAGRVHTLEAERDAARTERDTERAARLAAENREAAHAVIREADHNFTALEVRGLLADLPVGEDGTLNAETFTQTVTDAITEATERRSGVHGFGGTVTESKPPTGDPWADIDTILDLASKEA